MNSYRRPGLVLTDHRFTVPLDHGDPGGETIEIYAREAVAASRAGDGTLPWLLYLEGGPGFGARRFIGTEAWIGRAVREFRVLLLDQRGTGLSTPANRQTLPLRGGPREQAAYLAHFRADSIVRDCELVRHRLAGGKPWTVLGQSFGGFCAVHYLSAAPEGLEEVLITGGLPSLDGHADDVYRAAYPRIERKVAAHYARYPQDVARARAITAYLAEHRPESAGYRLTPESFQSLGIMLGGADGSHQLHHLLENAFVTGPHGTELSDAFQEAVRTANSFAGHPLYAVMHEAIYGQGDRPTAWSAERIRAEFPQFDAAAALAGEGPVLFTGESVHPWHFEVDPALRPLRETAGLLAARTDWPALYDMERLAANDVPVAAAVYHDDMYVDTGHALRTAASIRGLRTWVTSEFEHDGLRASGPRVLDRLLGLVRGESDR
ncbi:alpha/beta fold hydrolase [Streptomyces nitrosporeus]|uniref:Alpha/beta fold hydrolase n=1 Tax=Streptomyces nitrosporeus TaxID=28894 RepID=A0A5J6FHV0_9ACTN|nr:alpha/beta fold hydrolase [Streptomyces nitrosporeus]QEU76179.1 alpha/beta fold hydrolase [Streptomyces nitrosporeus]GGZ08491.1 alpha/beta hydrolase [Streptomyces nitrosporeus]